MSGSVRNLLVVEAVVALGIVVIGAAAGWTASDYTMALVAVCAVALFTTGAVLGRGAGSKGGAMTDPIARGSVRGTPAGAMSGTFEIAADDDASAEPDVSNGPAFAGRSFPLVPAGLAVASGVGALVSRLVFE